MFLLLRAKEVGVSQEEIPLLWAAISLTTTGYGTWTVPSDLDVNSPVTVICIGGGGNGGSGAAATGSDGPSLGSDTPNPGSGGLPATR